MERPLVVVMLCALVALFAALVVEAQDTDDVTFQAKDCHDHKVSCFFSFFFLFLFSAIFLNFSREH